MVFMKLHNLFLGELLENSIYAERFVNDSKGHFKDYSEVDVYYDPRGNDVQLVNTGEKPEFR